MIILKNVTPPPLSPSEELKFVESYIDKIIKVKPVKDEILLERAICFYRESTRHGQYQVPLPFFFLYLKDHNFNLYRRNPLLRLPILIEQINKSHASEFVDLGANVGTQILLLANIFPNKKFIAVEPLENMCKFIIQNIEILKLENVEVINAISNPKEIFYSNKNTFLMDFNVMHHANADFKVTKNLSTKNFLKKMIPLWFNYKDFVSHFFSMGFRLGGDLNKSKLNPSENLSLMTQVIEYIRDFKDVDMGIYALSGNGINGKYVKVFHNDFIKDVVYNQTHTLEISEFNLRPIFHLRSK